MAYLKPQAPLKDINSGDYFYPLTTIDQLIVGSSRLSVFLSENNNKLDLINIGNITTDNFTTNNIITGKIHSNAVATDNDITRIPSNSEIALETSDGDGTASAWIWREQYSSSNWGLFHDNSTNIVKFVGDNQQRVAFNLQTGRLYVQDWIEFSGNYGLFFPNSGSGTHLYPANGTTYGSFQMKGAKGGYYGITAGNSDTFLTFMCNTDGVHQGLFNQSTGDWAFYYNRTNRMAGIFSTSQNSDWPIRLGKNTYVTGDLYASGKVHHAIWNDYAEYRQGDTIEPGRCVIEQNTGIMTLATQRLQPGARIISDTFGSIMGKTEKAKTPIAVSGRVLVYPYRDKNQYELGAAVCTAPNGTVDIMTREEIMMYPERIIGTVSEIPNYEEWVCGGSNEENVPSQKIKVNGRIWIYVR